MNTSALPAAHAPTAASRPALATLAGQAGNVPLTRVALAYIEHRFKLYLRFGEPARTLQLDRWQLMVMQTATPLDAVQKMTSSFRAGWNGSSDDAGAGAASGQSATGEAADGAAGSQKQEQPGWAKRMHRRQQITHAATTAAHTLRGGDGGGAGQGPSLRDSDT